MFGERNERGGRRINPRWGGVFTPNKENSRSQNGRPEREKYLADGFRTRKVLKVSVEEPGSRGFRRGGKMTKGEGIRVYWVQRTKGIKTKAGATLDLLFGVELTVTRWANMGKSVQIGISGPNEKLLLFGGNSHKSITIQRKIPKDNS